MEQITRPIKQLLYYLLREQKFRRKGRMYALLCGYTRRKCVASMRKKNKNKNKEPVSPSPFCEVQSRTEYFPVLEHRPSYNLPSSRGILRGFFSRSFSGSPALSQVRQVHARNRATPSKSVYILHQMNPTQSFNIITSPCSVLRTTFLKFNTV